MALYQYGSSSKPAPPHTGKTEFEILKASHRFLRDDGEKAAALSWDEQLAGKYYDSLYREFAVCDLKHYKSGNFALRWRTEDEVLGGNGETTCGNTRCRHHHPLAGAGVGPEPVLTTLELPFAYEERGERKGALVKVVLCPKCVDKLMWKRRKEREREQGGEAEAGGEGIRADEGRGGEEVDGRVEPRERGRVGSKEKYGDEGEDAVKEEAVEVDLENLGKARRKRERSAGHDKRRHRRRSSRSRSPRERKKLRFS